MHILTVKPPCTPEGTNVVLTAEETAELSRWLVAADYAARHATPVPLLPDSAYQLMESLKAIVTET
jgi:hypothetical protein